MLVQSSSKPQFPHVLVCELVPKRTWTCEDLVSGDLFWDFSLFEKKGLHLVLSIRWQLFLLMACSVTPCPKTRCAAWCFCYEGSVSWKAL
jgi:hypothetical protein